MSRYLMFTIITLLVTGCDQGTKAWVRGAVAQETGRLDVIDGLFSVVHWENPGMGFSMLSDAEWAIYMFYAFHVAAAVVLLSMLRQLRDGDRLQVAALATLMSGAMGNGICRFTKQTVTDFILVYGGRPPALRAWLTDTFGTYAYPAFNVADMCIAVGVGLFLLDWLLVRRDAADLDPDLPARPLGT